MVKAWPGVPAIVTFSAEEGWTVGTHPDDVKRHLESMNTDRNRRGRGAGQMARKKGAEYVGRFKEVDGYLVIDEDSWREVEGDSYIGEDDAVENTRMGSAIEAEYRSLRLQRGWTFMGTSDRTLREARVAFVGLNPGGGGPNDNYDYSGIWAVETGNGYFDERWGPNGTQTTIQKQVQQWHKIRDLYTNVTQRQIWLSR